MKKSIILIVIGILLLAVDVRMPMGDPYPELLEATDLGLEFQGKVINNFIGTKPEIDVVPDLLGYAFLFLGSLLLLRKDKRFFLAILLIPIAVYYELTIPQLPYHFALRDLYLKAAGQNFIAVAVEIAIEFFVIHGIVRITNCMQNKWNNNELLAAWIMAMMSKGLLVGIDFFFGKHIAYYIYYVVMLGATLLYLNRLHVTLKFKTEEIK